jgi:hypothetical protein
MDITNKNVKIISIGIVVDNLILQKKKNEMSLFIAKHMKKQITKIYVI